MDFSIKFDTIKWCRCISCKFGNFRENFIFANSVERHTCDVKNSRQGHDLPLSIKDRSRRFYKCIHDVNDHFAGSK